MYGIHVWKNIYGNEKYLDLPNDSMIFLTIEIQKVEFG